MIHNPFLVQHQNADDENNKVGTGGAEEGGVLTLPR